MAPEVSPALRRGWTTGACAASASRAAFAAMLRGRFPDPVAIRLPHEGTATFPLALAELTGTGARAGIVMDAGDDPDITHGALIIAETAWAAPGSGIGFAAGEGVGGIAGGLRDGLAGAIAVRAREVALAMISGKTAVEVAIVDRQGSFLARVGA